MELDGKKLVSAIFVLLILVFIVGFIFLNFYLLPHSLSLVQDYEARLELSFPLDLYFKEGDGSSTTLSINDRKISRDPVKFSTDQPLNFLASKAGEFNLDLKLFGFIPMKTVEVNVLPEVKVIPGGQAVGVMVESDGVMVVRDSFVETRQGDRVYPARKAGLEAGDVIKKINGRQIRDKRELAKKIQQSGNDESLKFTVRKKSGELNELTISPVKSRQGNFEIGLYVDDGVSGVGTLTFFDPENGQYGALGHVITEARSQIEIDVYEGKIMEAEISGISSGNRGIPGQKQGTFFAAERELGTIEQNTRFGIYGNLKQEITNPYFEEPIPVASVSQVEEGPAKIYTVLEGDEIEEFEVELETVFPQSGPDTRSMVINITDPELRAATGGIIQGMSGSPIVQNNKLVGAVTHVFLNDPGRGYGVFAEWMLTNTEIIENQKSVVER